MRKVYGCEQANATISVHAPRKLLDQVRDVLRTKHYALATDKAYRHWIVEFLRFHRMTNRFGVRNQSGTEPDSVFHNLTVVATQG